MKLSQKLKIFIVTIIYIIIAAQNTYSGPFQNEYKELKSVKTSDGINQAEAYKIAKAFFLSKISGCGFPAEPNLEGSHWVSETRVGIAGSPGEPIFINKETGAITCGNIVKELTLIELIESLNEKNEES